MKAAQTHCTKRFCWDSFACALRITALRHEQEAANSSCRAIVVLCKYGTSPDASGPSAWAVEAVQCGVYCRGLLQAAVLEPYRRPQCLKVFNEQRPWQTEGAHCWKRHLHTGDKTWLQA